MSRAVPGPASGPAGGSASGSGTSRLAGVAVAMRTGPDYTLAPARGCSSVGRASVWHTEGRRFDPCQLHPCLEPNPVVPPPVGVFSCPRGERGSARPVHRDEAQRQPSSRRTGPETGPAPHAAGRHRHRPPPHRPRPHRHRDPHALRRVDQPRLRVDHRRAALGGRGEDEPVAQRPPLPPREGVAGAVWPLHPPARARSLGGDGGRAGAGRVGAADAADRRLQPRRRQGDAAGHGALPAGPGQARDRPALAPPGHLRHRAPSRRPEPLARQLRADPQRKLRPRPRTTQLGRPLVHRRPAHPPRSSGCPSRPPPRSSTGTCGRPTSSSTTPTPTRHASPASSTRPPSTATPSTSWRTSACSTPPGTRFFDLYRRRHPLRPGFSRRCRVYWLNTALMHVRTFGDKYLPQCEELVQQLKALSGTR